MIEFLKTQLQQALENDFFQGGFILGVITWLGYQIKTWPLLLWRQLERKITYEVIFDDVGHFYRSFSEWYFGRYPRKFKKIEVNFSNHPNDQDEQLKSLITKEEKKEKLFLFLSQSEDFNVIFYKRRYLWVRKSREKLQNASSAYNSYLNSYRIKGFFAKSAILALLQEVKELAESKMKEDTLTLNYNDGQYGFYSREIATKKTFDNLYFSKKEKLIKDLDNFQQSQKIYAANNINYKRGYFLHGPPGTGKTSIGLAMAMYLDMTPYVINIPSITNSVEFQKLVINIPPNSLILFDDADDSFGENRQMKNANLDFSTILGSLDGVYSPENVVFVMITNHIEKFEPAILRRFAFIEEIGYPSEQEIKNYLEAFYSTALNGKIEGAGKIPMSKIENLCLKHNNGDTVLDTLKQEMDIYDYDDIDQRRNHTPVR